METDKQKYDLSPLVEDYHTAQITDALDADILQGSYYVSVCRPLPPVHGRLCPPNAAVCRENSLQDTVVSCKCIVNSDLIYVQVIVFG